MTTVPPPSPAFRRQRALALALAVSAVLHLGFIAGIPPMDLGHAREHEASAPIVARLMMAPIKRDETAPAQPKQRVRAKKAPARNAAAPRAPQSVVTAKSEPSAAPVAPSPPPAAAPAAEELQPLAGVPYARQAPKPAPGSVSLPESAKLEYLVYYGDERFQAGRAVYLWEMLEDRYLLYTMVEATGLVALFFDGRLVQESEGKVLAEGLRPERYVMQRGTASRSETVDFDWEAGTALLARGGTTVPAEILPGVQDPASIIQQLAFFTGDEAGVHPVVVADPRKIEQHEVQIVAQETLDTPAGYIPTIHLRKQVREDSAKVDVWLATERFLVPVKVQFRDRRGRLFEQVVSAMSVHGPQ